MKDSFTDRDGSVVAPGDRVRILAVFEHIRGTVKRVESVDDLAVGVAQARVSVHLFCQLIALPDAGNSPNLESATFEHAA